MTLRINALFLVIFTGLLVLASDGAFAKPLQSNLETAWDAYLQASRAGNESELQKTMSSYSFYTLKNKLISAQRSLTPDIIKSFAKYSPDISKMKFVKVIEKGDNAGLIYVRDSGEKDANANPTVTFSAVKFVNESGWKVEATMNCDKPMYRDDGRKTQFYVSDLRPACAMDGRVKPAPALVQKPYSTALLDVFSYGYQAQVTVNGVPQKPVTASWSGVLIGGLCKNKNEISIRMTKVETAKQSVPKIRIRQLLQNRTTREVLKFAPQKNIEGVHTFIVSVR
ncbi:hypothetical protein DO021_14905 [Desulfobacter hydrogenophilus]|uniref:Uncharacterized protein n=1 Tax=Desulfobacter hydrogenophilus TaxID=2291 RepID=A0A328FCS4_9BACT|nr:hypothetical protein [Desulfobacter hydrogenophilus]NDY71334.1 hypothetical protein [Desulfobacter hydrogenophilus]QBH12267.1 hypothetical protein EYB58_04620 [Desulfobacter hydrogenophilus]RAM01222.1 hypothetical protein DO021_14905 [Desulfobacter hydrogenophilus]